MGAGGSRREVSLACRRPPVRIFAAAMRSFATTAWLPGVAMIALASAACGEGRTGDGGRAGGGSAAPGCIKSVLIIRDEVPGGDAALAVALTAAGYRVTTSSATSSEFAGAPALVGTPAPFGAVVLLDGGMRTPPTDMPAEGQKAIVDFVAAGHGLVLTEWAAFHVSATPVPRWQILAPLVLLDRSDSQGWQVTYQVDPAFAAHPLWAGLPPSFTFTSTSNVGTLKPAPGVSRVARSPQAEDAVAIRDLPSSGRVVHLAHAGNHVAHGWVNVNVQRLTANAVAWAARCERD